MAYLDPASNPESKSQRLSDKNCKSCTVKQNNFLGISCKLVNQKLYLQEIFVLFPSATFARKITEPLRKVKIEP